MTVDKRRVITLLPAYHQTDTLKKFFGATVDQVFQPGLSTQLASYVGRVPSYTVVGTDFYVSEPTVERTLYQLEPGMVSYDVNGDLAYSLVYPDIVGYLANQGADITDENLLFETDHYGWCPPINIDMFINYHEYYWFGTITDPAQLPIVNVTAPILTSLGDGVSVSFSLPASITTSQSIAETPIAVVNGALQPGTVSGNIITLASPPALGSTIYTCRYTDLAVAFSGQTSGSLVGLTQQVPSLTTGLLVRFIDATWLQQSLNAPGFSLGTPAGPTRVFFVDGVAQGIRLTPLATMQSEIEAHYTTVERSSLFNNEWSPRNYWVHRSTFAWSGLTYTEQQAVRPIIEFVRDIVLIAGQTWSPTTAPLFMLYDVNGNPLNASTVYPDSDFAGSRIFGYQYASSGTADALIGHPLVYDINGYIMFESDIATLRYTYNSGADPITGLYSYATDNGSAVVVQSIWHPAAVPLAQSPALDSTGAVIVDESGHTRYTVPANLAINPTSQEVTTLSTSDWTAHFNSLITGQTGFSGSVYSVNNWRDTLRDLSIGTEIVQHRAPLLRSMLLAANSQFDLLAALRYADREYNRYRNKLIQKAVVLVNSGVIAQTAAPSAIVAATLNSLKATQNNTFPFWLSTMAVVSSTTGSYFIPPTPAFMGIMPLAIPALITDDSYGTPLSMVRGHDGSHTPSFGDWRDGVLLAFEQQIYASASPEFQTDARPIFDINQYVGGRYYTPTYGYTIDSLTAVLNPLFEAWSQANRFDNRTNTLYDASNGFTWNYRGALDRYGSPVPGHWTALYQWYFDTDRPHTAPWELLGFTNKPSWWDGYYLDASTLAPAGSVQTYGRSQPPNAAFDMWRDLEAGLIRAGSRVGVDPRYQRTGLSDVIPVDATGTLLDPVTARIIPTAPSRYQASQPWQAGDGGPAENFWRLSPSYGFALAQASFLLKPARFVEQTWDTLNTGLINGQWVDLHPATYGQRPQTATVQVHAETPANGSAPLAVLGCQQWISDAIIASGQSPTLLGNGVRGLDVRLIHRMAGYVASNAIQAQADNFGLIPSEDVQIALYQSPASRSCVYSGVIVQWTGQGWTVVGYDARDPSFTVIPPDTMGPKGVISLAGVPEPTIYPWQPNTYYQIGVYVAYLGSTYACVTSHTSSTVFEESYWTPKPGLADQVRRVVTYLRGLATPQTVPYGTLFVSFQEVADFLLGWQRYLVSQGWVFDQTDPQTGLAITWEQSVSDFLGWTQVQWAPGNFISLSPGAQGLHFNTATGTVLNVENANTGFFGLLDRAGVPIAQANAVISRLDGDIVLAPLNTDIFCARLQIADIEHALTFSNVTIFNDAIYLPLFNLRQARIKLVGSVTADWQGRLDAPGYVVGANGGQLLANFDKTAEDVRLSFDIERADRADLRAFARHVVGFQERPYLSNLLMSDLEQFEFYQGMIQQKGAPDVFQKLLRSTKTTNGEPIAFQEEWAIRISRFGAPLDPRVTLQLQQIAVKDDPQFVRFNPTADAPMTWITLGAGDPRWLDSPVAGTPFFPFMTGYPAPAVPTAGPVRLSEVANAVLDWTGLQTLYSSLYTGIGATFAVGDRLWLYEDTDGDYNVYRVCAMGSPSNVVATVQTATEVPSLGNTMRVVTVLPHGLSSADIGLNVLIDGATFANPELQGFQTIASIDSTISFIIAQAGATGYDFTASGNTGLSGPGVSVLRSVRFATVTAIASSAVGFAAGDLVYVDNSTASIGNAAPLWGVYSDSAGGWALQRQQPQRIDPTLIVEAMIYDSQTEIGSGTLTATNPILRDLVIIDPLAGLIAGTAGDQITYQTSYDPASYLPGVDGVGDYANYGDNPWGAKQVGQVWWNLQTVRFLDPYTDQIGISTARDVAEISYRITNWSTIAPNTSVDVYEWVASDVDPSTYAAAAVTDTTGTYTGTVLNANSTSVAPSFSQYTQFDPALNRPVTTYYFWVSGRQTVPNVAFRTLSCAAIALAIINPTTLQVPWLAPILNDGLLISGTTPYLNDVSTVLKIQIKAPSLNTSHHEWILLRDGDASSIPPEWLWRHLVDSLAGFDAQLNVLPNPALAPIRQTGLFYGQNMFAIASPQGARHGLTDARQSFIGILNAILARNPIAAQRVSYLSSLDQRAPTFDSLSWQRLGPADDIIQPPAVEFQYHTYTKQQRDYLLADPAVYNAIMAGTAPRVLLDNINSTTPQWSIWTVNIPLAQTLVAQAELAGATTESARAAVLVAAATQVYVLATAYEYAVATIAQAQALLSAGTMLAGQRVLVDPHLTDANSTLFWAIYRWTPGSSVVTVADLAVWRTQTYDLNDFYALVDWYASGYSASNPPMTFYANPVARDAAEGASPAHQLVYLADGGTGSWVWTAFAAGVGWSVVAQERGTLQFSAAFYDSTRVVQDLTLPDLATSPLRDGSWEIRILANLLYYSGLMELAEINEMFFSMLHFVHVQQDQLDWAFKTSFMSIAGYNVPLTQTPFETVDQTPNFLDYINEVKPYHVKVRDFTVQYALPIDLANAHATDFDKPPYLDPLSHTLRPLDVTKAADQAVLGAVPTPTSANPYYDWYTNYAVLSGNPGYSLTLTPDGPPYTYSANPALIRSFTITLKFDRLGNNTEGFDVPPFDTDLFDSDNEDFTGSAADRITKFYQPSTGMPPLNINDLLGLDFKGTIADGFILNNLYNYANGLVSDFDWPINGFDTLPFDTAVADPHVAWYDGQNFGAAISTNLNPDTAGKEGGYQLADPFVNPNHPEERVMIASDDGLILRVTAQWVPGGCAQTARVFDASTLTGDTASFYIGALAQSSDGVFVYLDGVAVASSDITLDHLGQTVSIPFGATRVETVLVQTLGWGGIADVDGTVRSTTLSPIREQHLLSHDGSATVPLASSVSDTQVECVVAGQVYTPAEFHTNGTSLVFLTPPAAGTDVAITVREYGTQTACTVYRQTLAYNGGQVWQIADRDSQTMPEHAGTIVEVNGLRIMPPLTFYGNFTPSQRVLTLDVTPQASANVMISVAGVLYGLSIPLLTQASNTFNGNPLNVIVPSGTFAANDTSAQFAIYENYLVSLNGLFESNDVVVWVTQEHDFTVQNGLLTILTPLSSDAVISVTTFGNAGAMGIFTATPLANATGSYTVGAPWASSYAWVTAGGLRLSPGIDYGFSATRGGQDGANAMLPARYAAESLVTLDVPVTAGGSDRLIVTTFNGRPMREPMAWLKATSTPAAVRMLPTGQTNHAGRALWSSDHAWEQVRISAQNSGLLVVPLGPLDPTVSVALPSGLSPKLVPQQIFMQPDLARGKPGVLWIDGERIEYGLLAQPQAGQYVFGSLRRATQGTIALPHAAGTLVINGSGPQRIGLDVPTGPAGADREAFPNHMIIAGW